MSLMKNEIDPLLEIGRKIKILESLHRKLQQSHSDYETEVTSLSKTFSPKNITMNSFGGSSNSSIASSS